MDQAVEFFNGAANAIASNASTLGPVSGIHRTTDRTGAFAEGQKAGDVVSLVQAAGEMLLGGTMVVGGTAGGAVTAPTVVGAAAGAATAVAGFGVAGHGAVTGQNAWNNLFDKGNGRVNANRVSNQSSPSVTDQATKLKDGSNGGKNSVTIKTGNGQTRYDLAGKTHGNVPTPHSQSYKNNVVGGVVKSVTRTSKTANAMDNAALRVVRKYFERK